ncbi:MAG: hypothetical protein ACI4HM_04665 [Ruminococcus sp.]
MEKKKKYIIALISLVIVVIILVWLFYACQNHKTNPTADTTTTESKSLDFTPYNNTEDTITIPGIDGLNLKAGQLNQQVDFCNPSQNKCYFLISLFLSDGTLIWKSDYIAPSEEILEITLFKELQRGLYKNCRLVYDCYSLNDKSQLNSGEVKLEINLY